MMKRVKVSEGRRIIQTLEKRNGEIMTKLSHGIYPDVTAYYFRGNSIITKSFPAVKLGDEKAFIEALKWVMSKSVNVKGIGNED